VIILMFIGSIGEPSTQMTLNTFHLSGVLSEYYNLQHVLIHSSSGFGAANVTLGVPRLREIIMTASVKPKTPTMKLPITSSAAGSSQRLSSFQKRTSRTTLSQALDKISVQESISSIREGDDIMRQRVYELCFKLYSIEDIRKEFEIELDDIWNSFAKSFTPLFESEVAKEIKRGMKEAGRQAINLGKGKRKQKEGQEENENDENDAGTSRKGKKRRSDDEGSDDEDDMEDAKKEKRMKEQKGGYIDDEAEEAESDEEKSNDSDEDEDEDSEEDKDSGIETEQVKEDKRKEVLLEDWVISTSRFGFIKNVTFDRAGGKECRLEFSVS
jgi:DNA-directed RNA polymerase I subunit RPA1